MLQLLQIQGISSNALSTSILLHYRKRKITNLIKSKDGLVRCVESAVYQKQRNQVNNITRPAQLLVPTEIRNTDNDITNNKEVNKLTKDKKIRSQEEAEKNANILRKLDEY